MPLGGKDLRAVDDKLCQRFGSWEAEITAVAIFGKTAVAADSGSAGL